MLGSTWSAYSKVSVAFHRCFCALDMSAFKPIILKINFPGFAMKSGNVIGGFLIFFFL